MLISGSVVFWSATLASIQYMPGPAHFTLNLPSAAGLMPGLGRPGCSWCSAIRAAASKLGTFNLSGCEIYTSCEPCPMCLGAIYWARLDKMYYANNKTDAKNIGFDDSFIYDELSLKPSARKLPSEVLLAEEAIKAFQQWTEKSDKVEY